MYTCTQSFHLKILDVLGDTIHVSGDLSMYMSVVPYQMYVTSNFIFCSEEPYYCCNYCCNFNVSSTLYLTLSKYSRHFSRGYISCL